MQSIQILYPAFAMFLLTATVLAILGVNRFRAVRNREMDGRFFKLYRGYEEPDRLRLLSRHASNHFEVPPLFYIGVILIYLTGQVGVFQLVTAWAFVALRYLHTYIHLGSNRVTRRFIVFVISGFVLVALWASLLVALLTSS